jgi:molybdate transport system substrate-binding protein
MADYDLWGSAVPTMLRLMIRLAMVALLAAGAEFTVAQAQAQSACEPVTSVASPNASPAAGGVIDEVPFPDDGGSLTVFAAASLTDAFDTFAASLEDTHSELEIVIETAGSQTLVTQLQEGAKADVLATANASTMQTAVESGLVVGEPVPFAGNRLVIVTPLDDPAGIGAVDDLAGDDVRLVIANESVPAGNYARVAFCAYEASGKDGFSDAVLDNVVSEEEDVRSVLTKVLLGEADAGIVYASDAVGSELAGSPVRVVEFPEELPVSATYPVAAVAGGNEELARAFIAALLGPEGQAVLEEYGFTAP